MFSALIIILTIKNTRELAKHHRNNKKKTQSALNIIVTIKNNTEHANHNRNNEKEQRAR